MVQNGVTSEAHSDKEAHDGLEEATQSKRTFKYKSSHKEELIIGNKDNPLKTRLTFRNEHSMLGPLSLIEPTSIDEAVLVDGL